MFFSTKLGMTRSCTAQSTTVPPSPPLSPPVVPSLSLGVEVTTKLPPVSEEPKVLAKELLTEALEPELVSASVSVFVFVFVFVSVCVSESLERVVVVEVVEVIEVGIDVA